MVNLSKKEEAKFRHKAEKWYKKNKLVKKIFINKRSFSWYLLTRTPDELEVNIKEWLNRHKLSDIRIIGDISHYYLSDEDKSKYAYLFSKEKLKQMHDEGVSINDLNSIWGTDFFIKLLLLDLWHYENIPFIFIFNKNIFKNKGYKLYL